MAQIIIGNSTTELYWVRYNGEGALKYQAREDDKRNYRYTASVRVDASQKDDLMEKITNFYNEEAQHTDKFPYDPEKLVCYCPFKLIDGMFEFSTRTNVWYGAAGKELVQKRIDIFDGKNRIKNGFDKPIGNGSLGIVSANMFVYNMYINKNGKVSEPKEGEKDKYGVTLMLDKIQLIKHEEVAAPSPFEAVDKEEKVKGQIQV